MAEFSAPAEFFDGRTSRPSAVQVRVNPRGALEIRGVGVELDVPRAELRVGERVGQATWTVELAAGAALAFAATSEADALLRELENSAPKRIVHALERSWRWGVISVVSTAAALWALIVFGVPQFAVRAVALVPPELERRLGEHGIDWLDRFVDPSTLDAERRAEVETAFARVATTNPKLAALRLELRRGGAIGPNAFALPGGIVVMTDELVELAEHDDELSAVFAHELGHVARRHALQRLLESSAVALITMVITSDASTATSLGTSLPTVLLEAGYSRGMEREADEFALQWLSSAGIPHERFAAILERLERASGSAAIPEFLSTHPTTSARVEDARR
ncbi:MAG: M48 family metallopeptidase [Planctomycetes bacterium]|nr:M48 family metallopeptidase [Planctomycetota bacterium]